MALRRNPAADWSDETMVVFAAAMAIVLALAAVGLDFVTPVELDIAPLYALALLMAGLTRSSRLVWALVAVLVAVTFVVLAVNGRPGAFGLDSIGFANRVLDAAALLVTAGLLHIWLASLEVRDRQARELEAQNRKLAAANAALAEHDAELARQNAALDELRRLAEAASGRKTRMLTSVSHDIRSPVNAINLIVELIRRTAGDPEREAQLPRMVQRLQDNAASLLGLVTDVLDIAQFDAGHAQTRITAFSLDQLVAARCNALAPQAEAKGLELRAVPSAPLTVRTDPLKLDRILTNLVGNAIKFTASGSVTVMCAVAQDGCAEVTVCDTGPGIAPAERERIFEEFARSGGQENAVPGWGVGLAICRRLAGLLGAGLELESEPGKGSTFRVRLPATALATDDAAKASAALPPSDTGVTRAHHARAGTAHG